MKYSYNWLQSYFDQPLPSAEDIETRVSLQAFEPEEIEAMENDTMLDFDVLPNRAHDSLCHRGLAKEISMLFNLPLKENRYPARKEDIADSEVGLCVNLKEKKLCRRYIGRVIENIEVKESPQWLKDQLATIGQRSINNVVDATNYVMFDLGQPLHAFDLNKLSDKKEIIVRKAKKDEGMTLLTGEEVKLDKDNLVIADHDGPLAVAGVKGGDKAEVDNNTTSIVLEAANFEPVSTRKTSRSLKIQTDSSKRFENEITPELAAEAIEAVTDLILDMAGTVETKLGNPADSYPDPVEAWSVPLTLEKTNRLLGTLLGVNEVEYILERLDCQYEASGETWNVWPPVHRLDLKIQEDIIEEIGRLHGFDNIPANLPTNPKPPVHKPTYYTALIRNYLIDQGFHEVYTYTFTDHGEVEMANALASDKNFLRTNLHEGLTKSLEKNLKNAELFGGEDVKQFEVGSVFTGDSEEFHLALAFGSQRKKASFDLESVIQELGEKLGANLKAEFHNGIAELNLTPIIESLSQPDSYLSAGLNYQPDEKNFAPISAYPFVLRDIAVWLPAETAPEDLLNLIRQHSGELLAREPRQFDRYEKDGRVSYAYRIVLQSQDKTLTDEEANSVMDTVVANLPEGWEVR